MSRNNFLKLKKSYIEQTFPMECKGRDKHKNNVLDEPVYVSVLFAQCAGDATAISLSVECVHSAGVYNQLCKASHSDVEKKDNRALCTYRRVF